MIKYCFIALLFLGNLASSYGQNEELLKVIRSNSVLSYGGSDLITFQGKTCIVGVAAVDAGKKKTSMLIRIGKVKAEREVSTFINGSDITSSTESYFREEAHTLDDTTRVMTTDVFIEQIRENSEGFVKQMQPAGFWYSEDLSVFYYAIYKEVEL